MQEATLLTKGNLVNVTNKLCPKRIQSWMEFPTQQELIWWDLMDSEFVGNCYFTPLLALQVDRERVWRWMLSLELDLNYFEHSTVEDHVVLIMKQLYHSITLQEQF